MVSARRPLFVVDLFEFRERIRGIATSGPGEPSEFVTIVGLDRELHELVDGITTAPIGQTPQLGHVARLAGQLHQFVDRVGLTELGATAQLIHRIRVAHAPETPTFTRAPHSPVDSLGSQLPRRWASCSTTSSNATRIIAPPETREMMRTAEGRARSTTFAPTPTIE